MHNLAVQFRFMYLFAHAGHHAVFGPLFFADHKYLNELYETYEDIYDSILEKMIGLGLETNEFDINSEAAFKLSSYKNNEFSKNSDYFQILFGAEKETCQIAQSLDESATYGLKNFLQGLADSSEDRQYKIGQRLK